MWVALTFYKVCKRVLILLLSIVGAKEITLIELKHLEKPPNIYSYFGWVLAFEWLSRIWLVCKDQYETVIFFGMRAKAQYMVLLENKSQKLLLKAGCGRTSRVWRYGRRVSRPRAPVNRGFWGFWQLSWITIKELISLSIWKISQALHGCHINISPGLNSGGPQWWWHGIEEKQKSIRNKYHLNSAPRDNQR